MRSLQGKDEHFMSERQRQAELARLKREKLKAKQEDKFITAALVLGLAEKQKAAVEERLGTSHFLSWGGEGWWRMLGGDYMVFRGNRDKSSLTEYKKGTVENLPPVKRM